jgi:hypothetical protein
MDECIAEFIDGTWDTSACGCEDCAESDHAEIEHRYECGDIAYGEAIAAHDLVSSFETE